MRFASVARVPCHLHVHKVSSRGRERNSVTGIPRYAAVMVSCGEAGIDSFRWTVHRRSRGRFAGLPRRSAKRRKPPPRGVRRGKRNSGSTFENAGTASRGRSESWRPPPSARSAGSTAAARTAPDSPVVEADFALGPPKSAELVAEFYTTVVGSARRGYLIVAVASLTRLGPDRPIGRAERRGAKSR